MTSSSLFRLYRLRASDVVLHLNEGIPMEALLRLNQTIRELRGRWRGARLVSMVVVLLIGSTGASWSQESVGTTVIVINTVEGTLASGSAVSVVQGDAVYRDEGVRTRVDSKAGFLMEDKTNVTVGPSSTLKLDRFVYAGPKKQGTIVLNLAQGTCRLVIGDANKRSYTIVTPTAAIGIRG
jgi:FecR-like protein